ncbi:MAG: electron transfer flavoprotein subunit beta/FixA family protein [Clostridiales bacterium]|nr:electron transfer flavoprotein subunit beta/FixA family protein [Clostridiales bacterium]
MKIIVCIKQVPLIGYMAVDEKSGTLIRSGGVMNPCDSHALAAALFIKNRLGGSDAEITALSMGAPAAANILKEALAIGADKGVLISGGEFRGSDVYATAYALAQAVGRLGGADLILCGRQTADGDTGQVPFSLAAQLGIPVVGWVKKIEVKPDGRLYFTQELSGVSAEVKARFPMVAAVSEQAAPRAAASLKGFLKAAESKISVFGVSDFSDASAEHYGFVASPTKVKKIRALIYGAKSAPIVEPPEKSAERIAAAVKKFL